MSIEAYATLLTTLLLFGQHAKCFSDACRYLKIMPADNAALLPDTIPIALML